MAYRNRNFDRNNYGGSISRNVDPWDTSNDWGMRGGGNNNMGGGGGGGGSHGGSGGGQGGGNYNQNELANHLLQLLRNNGGSQGGPPSLMDLPQGDMRGYGYGGARNNGGGGDFDRFEDRRVSFRSSLGPRVNRQFVITSCAEIWWDAYSKNITVLRGFKISSLLSKSFPRIFLSIR